jgi:hypothetical protein
VEGIGGCNREDLKWRVLEGVVDGIEGRSGGYKRV